MSGQNFLIVQHLDWEAPGQHLLAALQSGGINYRILEAWHEPMPAVAGFDGLIVLGGSPNVDEEEQFPYLAPLKEAIRQALALVRPTWDFAWGISSWVTSWAVGWVPCPESRWALLMAN